MSERHRTGAQDNVNLPTPSPRRGDRKLTITVSDTVRPGDSVGTVHEHTIETWIPFTGTPEVSVDHGPPLPKDVRLDEWADPFFSLEVHPMAGACLNRYLEPSPLLAVSVLTIADRVHMGAGVDRFGMGPCIGYEILPALVLVGKYNPLDWHNRPVPWTIGAAYLF